MSATRTLTQWAALFRSAAAPSLRNTPLDPVHPPASTPDPDHFIASFADERSHRRPVDRPLLCALLGRAAGPPAPNSAPETVLWHAVTEPSIDPAPLLLTAHHDRPFPLLYHPADDQITIELRTEAELSALHALDHLACRRRDAALASRVRAAAAWHLAELQPDNATGHPWAIHVFARLAAHRDLPALVHAEGLLHACCVGRGHADRFSALILLHSARALAPGPTA